MLNIGISYNHIPKYVILDSIDGILKVPYSVSPILLSFQLFFLLFSYTKILNLGDK